MKVVRPSELRAFAHERGLGIRELPWDDRERYELPRVPSVRPGGLKLLERLALQKQRNFALHLPEATVYGGNLAVACGDALLPGGYAYGWNWATYESGFRLDPDTGACIPPQAERVDLEGEQAYVLGMTSHFGHFFIDCLDRVMALRHLPDASRATMLADGPMPPSVRGMAALCGFDESRARVVHAQPGRCYRVRNLTLVTLASIKPALAAANVAELRRLVFEGLRLATRPDSRRLYIGRRGVARRSVVNQEEVERLLSAQGYLPVYPEDHSLAATVATFAGADSVVLAYGSAKYNLIFCRPGTRVVCLVPEGADSQASAMLTTRHLCAILGLELVFCVCRVAGRHLGHHSDIEVDETNLRAALQCSSS